jgi:hypothetical protein
MPDPAAALPTGQAPSVQGNASLTDPVRLEECLAELNTEGVQPIVVDFARFDNQEAAIIVMAGRDGGYEIWAVKRTCGPGDAGELAFVDVAGP